MMNEETGRSIDLIRHIEQSIRNIVLTALGSRVMREDYGCLVPELIDQPTNDVLIMQLTASAYVAITQWEPRITLERIIMSHHENGLRLSLMGSVNGINENLSIPL